MISFHKIRRFFVTIVLATMLAITVAFDFGTTNAWAATSSISSISPSNTQLIAMWGGGNSTAKEIEGKAQETIGNITGDLETQSAGKAKQFKAQTLEGLNNSIVNPDYEPGGKTKQVAKEDLEGTKAIEAQARENFN
ncbi:CsbD family protein [Crocosphaera sp. XPORK-15E]|uniref:CsbD family protein n=1 Tax=Crocosphaera sp. XPORK-15E TaxID=3110247 RepID=UPI002B220595|nr:CsbD family protein [Crocosphaera sp. XPORK-15E]MEA5534653.1 CsbD family protein [Crocosphaera sp. XPORK-15E]